MYIFHFFITPLRKHRYGKRDKGTFFIANIEKKNYIFSTIEE